MRSRILVVATTAVLAADRYDETKAATPVEAVA